MSLADPNPRPLAHVYDAAYAGPPPNWDIGRPQRAFVRLVERGLIDGPVLDVGCGTGELSLFLARQGRRVLGIDLSTRAVAIAREKARWRRIDAHFLAWDALRVGELADRLRFRSVVDCACYHVLGDRERDRYVDAMRRVVPTGGACFVLGDARRVGRGTYGVDPPEFRGRFADGWRVVTVVPEVFERRYSRNRAYLGIVVRR